MLDEYFRNGLLFLRKLHGDASSDFVSFAQNLDISDGYIRKHYKEPIMELSSHSIIGIKSSEADLLKVLRRYFEISGKTKSVIDSLTEFNKGTCSYCGNEGEVTQNRTFIFPFERKIDSITPESSLLRFCKKCSFVLYCGMANYFGKEQKLGFLFDSYDPDALGEITSQFRKLEDPDKGDIR